MMEDLKLFAPGKPAKFVAHPLYDNFGEKISREEARAKLGIDIHENILLFFGFIRKYKGLDILLDAMKILQPSGNSPLGDGGKLLIAGEFYEDRKPYEEQIEKLGINNITIIPGDFDIAMPPKAVLLLWPIILKNR